MRSVDFVGVLGRKLLRARRRDRRRVGHEHEPGRRALPAAQDARETLSSSSEPRQARISSARSPAAQSASRRPISRSSVPMSRQARRSSATGRARPIRRTLLAMIFATSALWSLAWAKRVRSRTSAARARSRRSAAARERGDRREARQRLRDQQAYQRHLWRNRHPNGSPSGRGEAPGENKKASRSVNKSWTRPTFRRADVILASPSGNLIH